MTDTTVKPSDRGITADLMARLHRHYIPDGVKGVMPGGMLVPEVGINGVGRQHRCDAVFVGFTSGSGRYMVGHEVKASRGDWLGELRAPGKADWWADQCHAWYVVAPSTAVVKPEELPAGWGLLVPGTAKSRLTVAARATHHPERVPSWDAVRSVMARWDTLRAQAVSDQVEQLAAARQRQYDADVDRRVQQRLALEAGDSVSLRERLRLVEDALGMRPVEGSWVYRDDEISIDELRAGAASWIRAMRDVTRRRHDIEKVGKQLATARLALDDLQGAVQALADGVGATLAPAEQSAEQPARQGTDRAAS